MNKALYITLYWQIFFNSEPKKTLLYVKNRKKRVFFVVNNDTFMMGITIFGNYTTLTLTIILILDF